MLEWARRGNRQLWERLLRALLAVLLVVTLAYLLAWTFWLIVEGPQDVIPPANLPHLNLSGGDHPRGRLSESQVAGWHLFGVYQPKAGENTANQPVSAPETNLQLSLLGLFQSTDPKQSSAIIAEKGQDAELYHIGDRIPGNATLTEIYSDRVILRRQGRLETLRLESFGSLSGVSEVTPPSRPAPSRQPASLSQERGVLIHRLGLEPVSQGSAQGYRIGAQAPRALLSQVGLKVGDVILSVNGHPLGTENSDLAALRSYRDKQTATIVVDRGDQQFTVNYPP